MATDASISGVESQDTCSECGHPKDGVVMIPIAKGLSYSELMEFHGCEDLKKVHPDEKGDNACTAQLLHGLANPCHCKNMSTLKHCADYRGKLDEEYRKARFGK